MKVVLKPSRSRDHQPSGSGSFTKQEVGQGDEPAVSNHPEKPPAVVDGLSVSVPSNDRNEEGDKSNAISDSRLVMIIASGFYFILCRCYFWNWLHSFMVSCGIRFMFHI